MNRRIRQRRLLVALLASSQVLSMLLAFWWFSNWLETHMDAVIRAQLRAHGEQVAAQVTETLGATVVPDLDSGLDDEALAETIQGASVRTHNVLVFLSLLSGLLGAVLVAAILLCYDHRLLQRNLHLEELVEHRSRALVTTRDAIIFGLAKLAEWRDDCTGGHLERIRAYVETIARELARHHPDLDEGAIARLGLGSSLHDIGKVGIPDSVLLKPGPLDDDERAVIERHPLIGGNCLMALEERLDHGDDLLPTACEIALSHHERWDGTGYPYGIEGEEIPRSARIVAVADVYDALTSSRVYKDAMSHDEARRIILEGSGAQFDPEMVAAFLACEGEIRRIALKSHRARDHARERGLFAVTRAAVEAVRS